MSDTGIAILLIGILVLLAGSVIAAERRHRELIRLLNDLATMLGEMFDRDRKE